MVNYRIYFNNEYKSPSITASKCIMCDRFDVIDNFIRFIKDDTVIMVVNINAMLMVELENDFTE